MEVGSAQSGVQVVAQVKVANSQKKQLQAVVGLLLEGIKQAPRPVNAATGQNLNIAA